MVGRRRAPDTNAAILGGARVPVARLPVVLDPADRSPLAEVEAHAAALVPPGFLAARDGIGVVHAHTAIPTGSPVGSPTLGVPPSRRARLDVPSATRTSRRSRPCRGAAATRRRERRSRPSSKR
jgi:hypothetical protein